MHIDGGLEDVGDVMSWGSLVLSVQDCLNRQPLLMTQSRYDLDHEQDVIPSLKSEQWDWHTPIGILQCIQRAQCNADHVEHSKSECSMSVLCIRSWSHSRSTVRASRKGLLSMALGASDYWCFPWTISHFYNECCFSSHE